jgi:hypothetical protein
MEDHQMDRNVIWGNREASVAPWGELVKVEGIVEGRY